MLKNLIDGRNCPECGANWVSGEMTEAQKKVYAGTFFSRLTLFKVEARYSDYYECPDCKHKWPYNI